MWCWSSFLALNTLTCRQRCGKHLLISTATSWLTSFFYQFGSVLYTTDANDSLKSFNLLNQTDAFGTARKNGTGESYYLYTEDLRGSTVNVLDSSASQVVSYWYNDFGEVTESKSSGYTGFDDELQYTGAVYDASTGLLYLNARFYDPQTGRFISRDTYRGERNDAGTWHLYLYCANNPVNYVDPSGHLAYPGQVHSAVVHDIEKRYEWAEVHAVMIDYGEIGSRRKNSYGYCDVIRIRGRTGYIWEVKRVTCSYKKAKAQLNRYLNGKYHWKPSIKLKAGNKAIKANRFTLKTYSSDYVVEYKNAGGGIIYYDYKKVIKWKKVGKMVIATVMIGGIVTSIPMTGGVSAGALAFI